MKKEKMEKDALRSRLISKYLGETGKDRKQLEKALDHAGERLNKIETEPDNSKERDFYDMVLFYNCLYPGTQWMAQHPNLGMVIEYRRRYPRILRPRGLEDPIGYA